MLTIRSAAFAVLFVALAGTAVAGESVRLVDSTTAIPADGSVQVRTLGSKSVWIVEPGREAPGVGVEIAPEPGEDLYLVREHGAREMGRTLAAWDGFRLVALAPDADGVTFHHCAERLGWLEPAPRPRDVDLQLGRRTSPADKATIIDAIDLGSYTEALRRLSGDLPTVGSDRGTTVATRWTYSDGLAGGIDLATAYVIARLEEYGYTVVEQEFPMAGGTRTARNLLAIRPGNVTPDEVVVVGGHYDSITQVPTEDPAVSAPGAEDNASGTAGMLELARVFANVEPERSIHFIAFGGEEQGLFGSRHYVDQLATNGWTVVGAYTMDMIAAWEDDYGVLIEGDGDSQALMQTLRDNVQALGVISSQFSFNPFGSDHIPFIQANIPALLAIDLDWAAYDEYHTASDRFSATDPTLGYEITRAIAGAVVDLAGTVNVVAVDDDLVPPGSGRAALALADPYPNPFNPRTVISYAVPRPGPVSLRVYDARGRVVRRLVDEPRPAGNASVVWNGEDDEGRGVASGLYFVRLEHADRVLTRRAVLVR